MAAEVARKFLSPLTESGERASLSLTLSLPTDRGKTCPHVRAFRRDSRASSSFREQERA